MKKLIEIHILYKCPLRKSPSHFEKNIIEKKHNRALSNQNKTQRHDKRRGDKHKLSGRNTSSHRHQE